jgi:hypothetical protein
VSAAASTTLLDPAPPTVPTSLRSLATRLPDLWSGYLPGRTVSSRRRERLLRAAAIGAGATRSARLHGSWAAFLGDAPDERAADPLEAAIVAAAASGAIPADDAVLDRAGAPARQLAEAAVARGVVMGQIEGAASWLTDWRLGIRSLRQDQGRTLLANLGTVLATSPMIAATALATLLLESVNRMAGPTTPIDLVGSRDDLFADVVAASLPGVLASTPARLLVRMLPVEVVLGIVEGDHTATLRVGSGRVVVEPGVAADAVAVLDGGFVSMVGYAADVVVREALAVDPT